MRFNIQRFDKLNRFEVFSTADTAPKGRYVGGPVSWGDHDERMIAALDLPFEVVHPGTDAAWHF